MNTSIARSDTYKAALLDFETAAIAESRIDEATHEAEYDRAQEASSAARAVLASVIDAFVARQVAAR